MGKYKPDSARTWRGKSYKKGGERVADLRLKADDGISDEVDDAIARSMLEPEEYATWRASMDRALGKV